MSDRITAEEVARRLGVKRETVYAYVSRGLLDSRRALDGKTSTFDPDQVEALRHRGRRARSGELAVSIGSAITLVEDGQLWYRGHDALHLAGRDTDYEAVATLLWTGLLDREPTWDVGGYLRRVNRRLQDALPHGCGLLDRLRTAVVAVSAADELRHDLQPGSVTRAARVLLVTMVEAAPLLGEERHGRLADRLWPRLTATPCTPAASSALNGALVLLADHDLASSTLAARVAASVRADPYSVIQAGLGTLGGTLHGAASRAVLDLLVRAEAATSAAAALGDTWRRGPHLPGLGHGLYPDGDPRALVLFDLLESAAADPERLALATEVLDLARERTGVEPNIDFALAAFTFSCRLHPDAAEAVFAIARTAGWIAHALEEYGEAELRFRPRGRYLGVRPTDTMP